MDGYVQRIRSNEINTLISNKRNEKEFKYNADDDSKLIIELKKKLDYEPEASVWRNFLQGNRLEFKVFKSCCDILDIKWHQIIDWNSLNKHKKYKSNDEIKVQKLIKTYNFREAHKTILEIIPKKTAKYDLSANFDLYQEIRHLLLSAEHLLILSSENQEKSDLCLQIGNIYNKIGDYDESLKKYKESLKYSSNERQKFESLISIAEMKLNICDYLDSYQDLVKIINLTKSSQQYEEITKKALFYHAWALIYLDLNKSIILFEKLNKKIDNDDPWKAGIYHFLGRNKFTLGSSIGSIKIIMESINMYEKQIDMESKNSSIRESGMGHGFRWMSESYSALARLNQDKTENIRYSKYYLDTANEFFKSDETKADKGGLKFIPFHKAKISLAEDNIITAFNQINDSIKIFEEVKYKNGLVESYRLLQEIQLTLIKNRHEDLARKAFHILINQSLIKIDKNFMDS